MAARRACLEDPSIIGRQRPMLPAVRGLVKGNVAAAPAARRAPSRGSWWWVRIVGSHHCIDEIRAAGSDREVGLNDVRKAAGKLFPGGPAICGLEDSAISTPKSAVFIKALLLLP